MLKSNNKRIRVASLSSHPPQRSRKTLDILKRHDFLGSSDNACANFYSPQEIPL